MKLPPPTRRRRRSTQNICTGNAAGVLGTTCGCPANFKRIKQQTVVSTDTIITPPGGGPHQHHQTPRTRISFPVAGTCDALQVGTQTPQTDVEIKWCKRNTASSQVTFTNGDTETCGSNPTRCSSSNPGNTGVMIRQTIQRTLSSISYDGGAPVNTTTVDSITLDYSVDGVTYGAFPGSNGCVTNAPVANSNPAPVNGPVVNVNTGSTVTAANATIPLNSPQASTSSSSSSTSGTSNTLADAAMSCSGVTCGPVPGGRRRAAST